MSSLDQQTLELLERMRNRFYGKYRGTVKAIDANTLRIKAIVPAVLGQTPTGWCQPCVPYAGKNVGFLFLPEEGDFVWIEFEGGDPGHQADGSTRCTSLILGGRSAALSTS